MSVTTRLKRFYTQWLEPPGIYQWRTRHSQPDLQKFWAGTPVAAPPLESKYFHSVGLESRTITRRDDSRACGYVVRDISLPLPELREGENVQFAVTPDRWVSDSSVSFTVGGQTTTQKSLEATRWLDIRLDGSAGAKELAIKTDEPLWVSYPRTVQTRTVRTQSSPRHVIVLVIDGMGRRVMADRHPTECHRPITPNLDRFFAGGLDAPLGFASSEWTLPATASFFSGLYASRHRMVHPSLPMHYGADHRLLAEYFQEAGYHTFALSAGNRLTPAFGSHRGFDRFLYHWPYEGQLTVLNYDPAVWVSEIIGHVDLHKADATFTYAHFPDTHPAWNVPPFTRSFNLGRRGDSTGHDFDRLERSALGRDQGRQLLLLRLYEFDRILGSLLQYLDSELADETIVMLTADHGTPWPDFHDSYASSNPYLNEFRIGTFLKMKGRGVPPGRRMELVSPNIDLMPTLLHAAGMSVPDGLDGKDLLGPLPEREYVISESIFRDKYEVAISDKRRQWIERYPIDESSLQATGPAVFRGGFPLGCTNYSAPVNQVDPDFQAAAAAHLRKMGIIASTSSAGTETVGA
jgi:hypothetical protein